VLSDVHLSRRLLLRSSLFFSIALDGVRANEWNNVLIAINNNKKLVLVREVMFGVSFVIITWFTFVFSLLGDVVFFARLIESDLTENSKDVKGKIFNRVGSYEHSSVRDPLRF
jgi:hypothetical protein